MILDPIAFLARLFAGLGRSPSDSENDPADDSAADPLEARCARIVRKLREAKKRGFMPFGAAVHRFRLNPPLSEAEVAAFEARYGVRLPEGYRAFMTRVANGGAGPAYGLIPLTDLFTADSDDPDDPPIPEDLVRRPFPYTGFYNPRTDSAWDGLEKAVERGEVTREEADRRRWQLDAGSLALADLGDGYLYFLVVTGPTRGQVWVDLQINDEGLDPTHMEFLDWYERWLDRTLAGNW
jgi:SMI1 / KNR4 family (SUKH-1)